MFKEPYQIFFPLGLLFGMMGVAVWVVFGFFPATRFPSIFHSELMLGGFMWTFAMGFLMTAIPRFTGSRSANGFEKGILFLLVTGLFFAVILNRQKYFHLFFSLEILWISFFGVRRILRGAFSPPPSFLLIGFGLAITFAANVSLAFANHLSADLKLLSMRLIEYGFPQFLILGVGSQLLPNILGTLPRPKTGPQLPGTPFSTPLPDKRIVFLFAVYGLILSAAYILEIFVNFRLGCSLRALLITFILLFHWRFYKRPPRDVILTWGLWLSGWLLAISQWVMAWVSAYAIHAAHLFFIGSLSLMIFFVAARVTLTHGGYGQSLERSSKTLRVVLSLILLAMLTRVLAPFSKNYPAHLAYAALIWILALFLWSALFLKKIFVRKRD